MASVAGAEIAAAGAPRQDEVLTPEAIEFVAELERRFGARRRELLQARVERQQRLDAGELPDFLPETREIRELDWTIDPVPPGLQDRR
ncbi:MAG TPA: hypothetical protein VE693_13915, partial [Gaiellaceae bacterium]|nr:hypothetical protein [Gaiellaceae bacterium]